MTRFYPFPDEYLAAVRNPGVGVLDPVLRLGTPCLAKGGSPLHYSGGFAIVFKLHVGDRAHALRCWTRDVGEVGDHYQKIQAHLHSVNSPYFVEFDFQREGILARGQRFSTVRMDWLEEDLLGEFIGGQLGHPPSLRGAADSFLAMAASLHRAKIAHGDLQAENIMVVRSGQTFDFRLIDYDTMCVPETAGEPVLNPGLGDYQHPRRNRSVSLSERDDYFSELVIYLTLRALAEKPDLWAYYPTHGRDKELLFTAEDFHSPSPTAVFHELYQLSPEVKRLAVTLWNFSRCPSIQHLVPLEAALQQAQSAAGMNGQTSSGTPRSSLEVFLATKRGSMPDSWLDDSAFHATPAPAFSAGAAAPDSGPVFSNVTIPPPPPANGNGPSFDEIFRQGQSISSRPKPSPQTTPPPPTQSVFDEDVQFTVYRPQSMAPAQWQTWLAFAHRGAGSPDEPDYAREVEEQAMAILHNKFGEYTPARQESSAALPRESTITIVPSVDGLEFNPAQRSFVWQEPVHREEFLARVRAADATGIRRGKITFFLGALVVAEINVKVNVTSGAASPVVDSGQPMAADRARGYRQIFASYSRHDSAMVEHFEQLITAFGDRYLRDVRTLRAGEEWSPGLEQMIRRADIFQLFWSSNSMRSRYVRQEWEFALGLGRPNFVRPTFWEDPFPKDAAADLPPDALGKLHFQRLPENLSPAARAASSHAVFSTAASAPPPANSGDGSSFEELLRSRQPCSGGAKSPPPTTPSRASAFPQPVRTSPMPALVIVLLILFVLFLVLLMLGVFGH